MQHIDSSLPFKGASALEDSFGGPAQFFGQHQGLDVGVGVTTVFVLIFGHRQGEVGGYPVGDGVLGKRESFLGLALGQIQCKRPV